MIDVDTETMIDVDTLILVINGLANVPRVADPGDGTIFTIDSCTLLIENSVLLQTIQLSVSTSDTTRCVSWHTDPVFHQKRPVFSEDDDVELPDVEAVVAKMRHMCATDERFRFLRKPSYPGWATVVLLVYGKPTPHLFAYQDPAYNPIHQAIRDAMGVTDLHVVLTV
jgi:hypothetical protein